MFTKQLPGHGYDLFEIHVNASYSKGALVQSIFSVNVAAMPPAYYTFK